MVRTSSVTMPNIVGLGLQPLPGGQKVWCLFFVCPSRFLNGKVCPNDFTIKAFEFRNGFDIVE